MLTRLSNVLTAFKNVVSMLIKDKDITSYQLLLKQDRVLVKQSTCFFDRWIWIFSFFHFSKKMGRSGDGKPNILFGWPKLFQNISLRVIFILKNN